jgi:D-alanyl-D-alanine carboxypeptidase
LALGLRLDHIFPTFAENAPGESMNITFPISLQRSITLTLLILLGYLGGHTATPDLKVALAMRIDSLLDASSQHPFNGIVYIGRGGKALYARRLGYGDMLRKTPFTAHPQFVIGSVTKQITAVVVLRACAAHLLDLHTPIHHYLPDLPMPWADTVTLHHLLNHTAGYEGRDKPVAFRPGAKFAYSNQGYGLLADIVAQVSGKSYEDLVMALYRRCHMRHATTPSHLKGNGLLTGYSRQPDGSLQAEPNTMKGAVLAAGLLMSSPEDIARWNDCLHAQRKLLTDQYYVLMTTPTSKRPHPIFGEVDYGYGLQMTQRDRIYEISHGGYVPGFVSVNFYYPATKTSLVVMENLDWMDPAFKESFYFEMAIRRILRESGLLAHP